MNFSSFMAIRYLKADKANRFVSWITTLAILGIAIGVATMVVVLSVIDGFEDELRNRFLAANAHVLAYRFPAGMRQHEEWVKMMNRDFGKEILGFSPFIHAETMGRKDHLIHAVLVRGIDPEKREQVQPLQALVRPVSALDELAKEVPLKKRGLPDTPGIIVGGRLLSIMNAKIGDVVELISPVASADSKSGEGSLGDLIRFKILGVYDSGLHHYDSKLVLLSIPAAQKLLNMDDNLVTGLEIGLKNPNKSAEIAQKMNDSYDLSVKEWQSYNHNIFEAMRNERTIIAFIVALVAFVASFNILATLFIFVSQKQRDISVLKSLGASNRQILAIFLKQSTLMGLIGGVLGLVLALLISYFLSNYPFIDLPDIYLLAKLPIEYDPRVYLGACLVAIIVSSLAGLYPAWSAMRVVPTEGLSKQNE
ncbi:MAG: ABC transporter permease [Oligoflexales bacterium]|nr:ABC transporter permease [Oligoflexales bacterium]